ncbi:hypothetical protein PFTANZ_06625, partial [Plasmodium falciparum Tanzania (2000708)]
MHTTQNPTSGEKTTLTDFISRPPYFRYLEEWGQNFCVKRERIMKKLDEECRGEYPSGDPKYCSGDGHDCTKNGKLKHKNMSADPDCPGCYKQCRKYRKWIDIKFEEFHNQKNKYGEEHGKVVTSSTNGGADNKKFCQQIKEKSTVQQFLESLNHCKNGEDNKDGKNKIDFKEPLKTFGPLDYCKTCPPNEVNCNGSGRGTNHCTPVKGKGKSWEKIFSENGEKTTITVEMIDRRWPFIKNYSKDLENSQKSEKSNDLFKTSRLFKGIRKQKWKCKVIDNNTDVCKLDEFKENIDLNDYTTFKVLLIYWLQDFIEGYYILKKRKIIEQCKENGGETCNENSKNDCACVKEWVDQKEKEWKQIQEHFNNRNQTKGDDDMKSLVRHFMETLIPRMDLVNDKGKIKDLPAFLKLYGCNCADNSQKKGGTPKDIVECLLENLGEKAKKCAENHAQTSGIDCTTPPTTDTPTLEDEDLLLEENENPLQAKKNMMPTICKDVVQIETAEEKEDGTCDAPVDPSRDEKPKEEDGGPVGPAAGGEETPKAPEAKDIEAPPSTPATPKKEVKPPSRRTPQIVDHPAVIPALMTSTLAWSVGIGFATFTYFYLK